MKRTHLIAVLVALAAVGIFVLVDTGLTPGGQAQTLAWLLFSAAAIFVPVAAMIAILRHRLYEIDRIIGRTFVYGALTAILAGLYSAGIQLFTWFFKELTGQSSDGALVLTTLVLATTFTPIKRRLERIAAARLQEPAEVPVSINSSVAFDLDDPNVRAFAATVAAMVRQELEGERSA